MDYRIKLKIKPLQTRSSFFKNRQQNTENSRTGRLKRIGSWLREMDLSVAVGEEEKTPRIKHYTDIGKAYRNSIHIVVVMVYYITQRREGWMI